MLDYNFSKLNALFNDENKHEPFSKVIEISEKVVGKGLEEAERHKLSANLDASHKLIVVGFGMLLLKRDQKGFNTQRLIAKHYELDTTTISRIFKFTFQSLEKQKFAPSHWSNLGEAAIDLIFDRFCESEAAPSPSVIEYVSFRHSLKKRNEIRREIWTVNFKPGIPADGREPIEVYYKTGKKYSFEGKKYKYSGSGIIVQSSISCQLYNDGEVINFLCNIDRTYPQWEEFWVGVSSCMVSGEQNLKSYRRVVVSKQLLEARKDDGLVESIIRYLRNDDSLTAQFQTSVTTFLDRTETPLNEILLKLSKLKKVNSFNSLYPRKDVWFQNTWTFNDEKQAYQIKRVGSQGVEWFSKHVELFGYYLYIVMTTNAVSHPRFFFFDVKELLKSEDLTAVMKNGIKGLSLGVITENEVSKHVASKEILFGGQGKRAQIDDYSKLNPTVKTHISSNQSSVLSYQTELPLPTAIKGSYDFRFVSYSKGRHIRNNPFKILEAEGHGYYFEYFDNVQKYYYHPTAVDYNRGVLFITFRDKHNKSHFTLHLMLGFSDHTAQPEVIIGTLTSQSRGNGLKPVAQLFVMVRQGLKRKLSEKKLDEFLSLFYNPVSYPDNPIYTIAELEEFVENGYKKRSDHWHNVEHDITRLKRRVSPTYKGFVTHLTDILKNIDHTTPKLKSSFPAIYRIFFYKMLESDEVNLETTTTYSVVKIWDFWKSNKLKAKGQWFESDSPESISLIFKGTINRVFLINEGQDDLTDEEFDLICDHYKLLTEKGVAQKVNIYVTFLERITASLRSTYDRSYFVETANSTYYTVNSSDGKIRSFDELGSNKDEYGNLITDFKKLIGFAKDKSKATEVVTQAWINSRLKPLK